jgi:hypothetical protein
MRNKYIWDRRNAHNLNLRDIVHLNDLGINTGG